MSNKSIGVFDSGLGGLTIVKKIRKILPKENIIYLGDTARVPYGTRSKSIVTKFAKEDVGFLIRKDVKCIVIACNTASAMASDKLRNSTPLKVLDVISSGSKDAVSRSKNKKIGVVGTRGTVKSGKYLQNLIKLKPDLSVVQVACPLLVPLIEEGELSGSILKLVLKKYLVSLKGSDIDSLILGCTHYPLVKKYISNYFDNKVNIIDPADQTALDLKDFLEKQKLVCKRSQDGKLKIYVTDVTASFKQVAERFLGEEIDWFKKVEID